MGLIPSFGLTGNEMMILVIISVAYALATVFLQRKVSNAKKLRETQAKIQKVSDEIKVMMKNKAPEAEIMAKQKEIMPLVGESMRSSLKPMFIILPIFAAMYYFVIPHLPFAIGNVKNVQEFFFIVVFIVGFVVAMVMMVRDRKIIKAEEKALEAQEAAGVTTNK
jgi:uncharacterized membrane protein (DUF106 family)